MKKEMFFWGVLRLSMGWIFLWSFFDKLIGLGFSTTAERAWLAGGSPTFGFLTNAANGPFAEFYQSIAGHFITDWLFMLGLLLIGASLLSGILVKIAGYSGALMMMLMYTAVIPPAANPFLDSHIIYALVLIGFAWFSAGDYLGFGRKWKKLPVVKNNPILE